MAAKPTVATTIRLPKEDNEQLKERYPGVPIARICKALVYKLIREEIELDHQDFALMDKRL